MPSSSSTAWAVWLIIVLLLIACLGIIIWFAIDSTIPTSKSSNIIPESKMGET